MANPTPGQKPTPSPSKSNSESNKATKLTTNAHGVLLALLVEAGGIVVVVTVAGLSDSVANLLILFSAGLWLLYLVMNADQVAGFADALTNIESGAKQ